LPDPSAHFASFDPGVLAAQGTPAPAPPAAGLPLSTILGGGALILNLFQQLKARKDAKKLQEEMIRREAFRNLIAVAGGGQPGQAMQLQQLPQVDAAGALGGAAQLAGGIAGLQKKESDAELLRQYQNRIQTERERHNVATEGIQGAAAGRAAGAEAKLPFATLFKLAEGSGGLSELQQFLAANDPEAFKRLKDAGAIKQTSPQIQQWARSQLETERGIPSTIFGPSGAPAQANWKSVLGL